MFRGTWKGKPKATRSLQRFSSVALQRERTKSMRLAKYLARCGVASRRASEELIEKGRVKVDSVVVKTPAHNIYPTNKIFVDNKAVCKQLPVVSGSHHLFS